MVVYYIENERIAFVKFIFSNSLRIKLTNE